MNQLSEKSETNMFFFAKKMNIPTEDVQKNIQKINRNCRVLKALVPRILYWVFFSEKKPHPTSKGCHDWIPIKSSALESYGSQHLRTPKKLKSVKGSRS